MLFQKIVWNILIKATILAPIGLKKIKQRKNIVLFVLRLSRAGECEITPK